MAFTCFVVMGKAEGSVAREEWHGHVTALSVAPEFRRLGLAAKLMEMLEEISERSGNTTTCGTPCFQRVLEIKKNVQIL